MLGTMTKYLILVLFPFFVAMATEAAQGDPLLIASPVTYDSGTGLRDGSMRGPGTVNNSGTAVGSAREFVGGSAVGTFAVRWNASSTTELGNLVVGGIGSSGTITGSASAINDAGTAIGQSYKYVDSTFVGNRAVRWNASGAAATELDNLGTDSKGYTNTEAHAINDAGTTVGTSSKYADGISKGTRAVR
jgi:hypothetical protein